MEYDNVVQILHQLGVDFRPLKVTDDIAIYEVPQFGTKVVWSLVKYEDTDVEWNVVVVYPQHTVKDVRDDILWSLAKGGFFNYLRNKYPNTFKQMLAGRSGEDWHQKIIKKRLEFFGDKPKYNYFKELNTDYLRESSSVIMSVDESFYDVVY